MKTDHFQITFTDSGMSLYSLIENKTYNFTLDTSYEREIKDNAKMAYEHVASVINRFVNPYSVEILRANVQEDTVYIYVRSENRAGGSVLEFYEIRLVNTGIGTPGYYMDETNEFWSSNIDVDDSTIGCKDI